MPPKSLLIKLASIAVHVEEFLDTKEGQPFDRAALQGLLQDPEVRGFLDHPKNKVFLPLKR